MQDIIPPQKPRKKLKIALIVLGVILAMLFTASVTYFLTKKSQNKVEPEIITEEMTEEEEEQGEFVYVAVKSGLNMRAGDSTEYDIIYTLPYRAKLKIEDINEDETWYKTTYNQTIGWFAGEYISEIEPEDLTVDWPSLEIEKTFSYKIKYPDTWRRSDKEGSSYDFRLVPKAGGFSQFFIDVSDKSPAELKASMLDNNHTQAGNMPFYVAGIKGTKIVIQALKNNRVVYTEDVIFLEKDGKTIRIVGPASGEELADDFNLMVWSLEFKDLKTQESEE